MLGRYCSLEQRNMKHGMHLVRCWQGKAVGDLPDPLLYHKRAHIAWLKLAFAIHSTPHVASVEKDLIALGKLNVTASLVGLGPLSVLRSAHAFFGSLKACSQGLNRALGGRHV